MEKEPATLAERVKYLRGLVLVGGKAMSQRDVARACQMKAENHVGYIERGGGVTLPTAHKLAAAFGVSLDWLTDGRGEKPVKAAVQAAVDQSLRLAEAMQTKAPTTTRAAS